MTQSGQRRSPSVLVTDDTEATREVVARLLAAEGYAVDTAAHGPEALEKVGERLFDLYLLDLSMPMMTGEELAILIRRYHPEAKLLYITAHSARLFQETALLKDTESFLQKPFGAQDLREAVSLMLFGHLQGLHANDAPLP